MARRNGRACAVETTTKKNKKRDSKLLIQFLFLGFVDLICARWSISNNWETIQINQKMAAASLLFFTIKLYSMTEMMMKYWTPR